MSFFTFLYTHFFIIYTTTNLAHNPLPVIHISGHLLSHPSSQAFRAENFIIPYVKSQSSFYQNDSYIL